MADYYKQGSFSWAGGGKAGAIIDLWAVSRFAGAFPAEGQAPPSGSPDAGPVVTGATEGNPGGYLIQNIPVVQDYFVRAQYGGTSYWGGCPAGSIGGQGSGGGGGGGTPFILEQIIYAPATPADYPLTTSLAAVDTTHLTAPITFPASGQVIIEAQICLLTEASDDSTLVQLAFVTHGTTTQVTPKEQVNSITYGAASPVVVSFQRVVYRASLSGTPAATTQVDLAGVVTGYQATLLADDGTTGSNAYGPALITVYDAAGTGGGGGGSGAVSSVSNVDGSLTFSPTTGGVLGSLANPIPVPVVITPAGTTETNLTLKAFTGQTADQLDVVDSDGNIRTAVGPTGGIQVYRDAIEVSYNLLGSSPFYLGLDASTQPPSVYFNGNRWWITPSLPTSNTEGVVVGTANIGDRCYAVSTMTEYLCLGAGTPGYNGIWAVSNAMVPANIQTANYTLALTDVGGVVEMNSSSPLTITFPPSVFGATMTGEIYQEGAGAVTCVAGAGVTIRSPSGLVLGAQYATVSYRWRSATEVVLSGDLT